jgi:hypothetical protein
VPVEITLRVEITLCVWKSHSACINHTRICRECHIHTLTCQNYTRVCGNHNLRVKPHSVEITLVRYIQTPYPPPMDPRLLTDQFFEIYIVKYSIVLWICNCFFQQLFFETLKSFETKKSQFNFKTEKLTIETVVSYTCALTSVRLQCGWACIFLSDCSRLNSSVKSVF